MYLTQTIPEPPVPAACPPYPLFAGADLVEGIGDPAPPAAYPPGPTNGSQDGRTGAGVACPTIVDGNSGTILPGPPRPPVSGGPVPLLPAPPAPPPPPPPLDAGLEGDGPPGYPCLGIGFPVGGVLGGKDGPAGPPGEETEGFLAPPPPDPPKPPDLISRV